MRSEEEVNRAVEQYADMVLRLCTVILKNQADAEDVFQTVFLKYAVNSQRFDGPAHEKAWFIRVTVNACKDLLKNFFHSHTVSIDELAEYSPGITQEQYDVLEAVLSLPKQYRRIVYLYYYEGYTVAEIGQILQKKPNTIYTQLRRAKEMLKKTLGGATCGTGDQKSTGCHPGARTAQAESQSGNQKKDF